MNILPKYDNGIIFDTSSIFNEIRKNKNAAPPNKPEITDKRKKIKLNAGWKIKKANNIKKLWKIVASIK